MCAHLYLWMCVLWTKCVHYYRLWHIQKMFQLFIQFKTSSSSFSRPFIFILIHYIASSAALRVYAVRVDVFPTSLLSCEFYTLSENWIGCANCVCVCRVRYYTFTLVGCKRRDKWSYFCHLLHRWKPFEWKKKRKNTNAIAVCRWMFGSAKIISWPNGFCTISIKRCIKTTKFDHTVCQLFLALVSSSCRSSPEEMVRM